MSSEQECRADVEKALDAVIDTMPEMRAARVSYPQRLKTAAVELFMRGECEGSKAAVIRDALRRLED